MLLSYTGVVRFASDILLNQIEIMALDDGKTGAMQRMADMTEDFRRSIQDNNLDWMGELLHEAWLPKDSISAPNSNELVDNIYASALRVGSLEGNRCLPSRLHWTGTSIVLYSPNQFEPDWLSSREGGCA
jgi:galactokinase/mevalonate kinase-like predicted kinase